MSTLLINNTPKSPEAHPAPAARLNVLGLPQSLTENISSFLSHTPHSKTGQELVSHAWTKQLPINHLDLSWSSSLSDEDLIRETSAYKDTLKSIDLSGCSNITDKGLQYLATFKKLESLKISQNEKITDKGFAPEQIIKPFARLKKFEIWGCPHFTDKGLASLASLKKLESLVIGTRITGRGFAPEQIDNPFAQLKNLVITTSRFSGESIKNLPKDLTSLTFFNVGSITNKDLAHLSSLENLQSLTLEICPTITNEGLDHLSTLTHLTSLNLEGCRVGGDGLHALLPLTHLTELNLSINPISDDDLISVSRLDNLKCINLNFNDRITNKGIAHLFRLQKLSTLVVEYTHNRLTKKGIMHLQRLRNRLYKQKVLEYLNIDQPVTTKSSLFPSYQANDLNTIISQYAKAPLLKVEN